MTTKLTRIVLGLLLSAGLANAGALIPIKATKGASAGLVVWLQAKQATTDGAQVWVETRDGKLLFEGKTTLDESGRGVYSAPVTEDQFNDGVAVTVYKEGFEIFSISDNQATELSIELSPTLVDSYATLKGTLTGFVEPDSDDYVKLGLVAKSLRMSDLAELDPSSFISPWKDTIEVFGKRELPSNLVLPDQTLSMFFIPIRVNKPDYRLPVLQGTNERYFGVTAQAVAQDLVQAVRNKAEPYELLDLLEFKSVGYSDRVSTPLINTEIKLDLNAKTKLQDSVTLDPPSKGNGASGVKHLAVALSEVEPGVFVANDIKQVKNAAVTLATASASARVLDLWTKGGDHIRGAWVDKSKKQLPDVSFDRVLDVPAIDGDWLVPAPQGTNFVVGHVEKRYKTSIGSNRVVSLWTVYTSGQNTMKLPVYALSQLKDKLGEAATLSVDLLEVGAGGYPLIDGDKAEQQLRVFEKVRTTLDK